MLQKSSPHAPPGPVGPSPVQSVLLVKRFERTTPGLRFAATSLPGHLLHLVETGHVRQECNGRQYELRPDCVMWYHEDELVRGVLLKAPWTFYSVNFVAPALPPPDFENRLMPGHRRLRPLFQQLHDAWRAEAAPARELRVQSLLLQILSELTILPERSGRLDPVTRLWWEIETECRRDLSRPFSLHSLSQMTRRSPATIARSCQEAVGVPPMKRLKHVRLSLARGLVLQSELTISEIAARVGYARIHELSRDYHRHFGHAPSADR